MADQYQPLSINTGSAQQAIQSTPNVTPNLDGLMQSIQSGFISADDIRKRVANGPLEAATRSADLADVTQVRPLQTQAQVAQLQEIQAKQKFEAEALPILDDIKREQLKQDYQNVLQHGTPDAVIKTFNQIVPGFIPYDNAKLYPKGGGLNTEYALSLMTSAIDKAEKLKLNKQFTAPVKQTVTGPTGASTETSTVMNQITGQPVGVPITTETKAAQAGANVKEIRATRYNPVNSMEEETVQRFDTVTGQLMGEATVVGSKPVKLTKEQADALQFSDRMGFNNQKVEALIQNGFDPTAFKSTVQSFLPNRLKPEALQAYTAAKNNWITAALRKESGAAISQSEYVNANREYFPSDGDSPAVVKQKESLRLLAEEDIRSNSPKGGFWNPGGGKTPATNQGIPADLSIEQLQEIPISGAAPSAPANIPTVQTPAEASALPPNVQFFKTPTGQTKINPNYRP